MELTPATREFHWISSVEGNPEVLRSLHEAMMDFYSTADERAGYQEMLDDIDENPDQDSSTLRLARYITESDPDSVFEVGCGEGRLYRTLRRTGYEDTYVGCEVAQYVVERNRRRHSDTTWHVAGAYDLPSETESAEVVCAEFVLEHLAYPVRALEEMLRVVRPGGQLVLIFPDFVCAGRLASQVIGLSPGATALKRARKVRLLDAVVSLYDSRVRLPRALKEARKTIGPFPVNLRPKCLTYRDLIGPDVDAVYIASKKEVESWASSKKCAVTFPWGTKGRFHETAHMAIEKNGSST